jgi:hypothetical protein|tara:strand:+ start:1771 stop:2112 length:342 start_codon:yes stop_codon:yes gene_type:complete
MKIHNLWAVCLLVRFMLSYIVKTYGTKNNTSTGRTILSAFLLAIGTGFIYKGTYGSNNEVQVAKVFWHDTRYVHGILYLLASFYLYNDISKMSSALILTDIAYSIIYRLMFNK